MNSSQPKTPFGRVSGKIDIARLLTEERAHGIWHGAAVNKGLHLEANSMQQSPPSIFKGPASN